MVLSTRSEAGRRLAEMLAPLAGEHPLIFALTPGGARVAFEIAQRFGAPLDLVSARKLEVPGRWRSAFGAVTPESVRVSRPQMKALALPKPYVRALVQREEREAMLEERVHRGAVRPLELEDRLVILVDDGLADPMVVSAAVAALRARHPARVFVAVPLASPELKREVGRLVDCFVVLRESDYEPAPILCDDFFIQTTWEDVRRMVELSREQEELVPA
jgi:putative phosphoribosyl transferase